MTLVQFARPKNRKLDLVVTGTGRCGTAFASELLMGIGIPAGHEIFFSHGGLPAAKKMLARRYYEVVADCAWEAAPYLNSAPLRDALVVHQVRHPKRVIESCMRFPTSNAPPYALFLVRHLPQIREYIGELSQSAYYWTAWNRMIENAIRERHHYFWRIEDGTDGLLQWLDEQGMVDTQRLHPAHIYANTQRNRHQGKTAEARLEDMNQTLVQPLRDMMKRYGYDRWE